MNRTALLAWAIGGIFAPLGGISAGMADLESRIVFERAFTPQDIHERYNVLNGAIYGATVKRRDGRTDLANLFLIGTDQGFLGVTGAMLSGISMANLHGLKA